MKKKTKENERKEEKEKKTERRKRKEEKKRERRKGLRIHTAHCFAKLHHSVPNTSI
jgi:hypothetical protein